MSEAHFYLLSDDSLDKKYRVACRLIAKAYQNHLSSYVHCTTLEEIQCLDSLLWTFQDISFVPHTIATTRLNSDTIPVILGRLPFTGASQQVLINLTQEVPEFAKKFERTVEIILPKEADKQIARVKYKQYQAQRFNLHTYTLPISGKVE